MPSSETDGVDTRRGVAIKIWTLDRNWWECFRALDTQRLLAQHFEHHTILSMVARGRRWKGWEEPQYRFELVSLHDMIVEELRVRKMPSGLKHLTPVEHEVCVDEQRTYPITDDMLEDERWALTCRWNGVYKGRDEPPFWWLGYEERYQAQGGVCLHNGDVERIDSDTYLCLLCKQFTREAGTKLWEPKRK